jgi:hypothetical protein
MNDRAGMVQALTDQLPRPPPEAPPPTPPKPRRWPWVAGIVAALLIGIGIGAASTPEEEEQIPVAEAPASPSLPPLPSPSPPVETTVEETTEPPNLDGTWVVTACDLQLFTGGDMSTLVGAVEVENTGNVPALVSVSLKWDALPGPLPDGGKKEVTLNPGASRELRFTTRINGSDVDRVQSSPGYQAASDEKFCKVMASIDEAS